MISAIIDVIGILGLAMLGCGLWLVSPVWMLLIMGGLFVLFSLLSEAGTITIRNPYRKRG